jgi:aspartate racemase
MKLLGLVGGTSWASTIDYYKGINLGINKRLGGLEFAECIIYSVNFGDIKRNIDNNNWEDNFQRFKKAIEHLRTAGASAIVLCAATPHLLADRLEEATGVPIIHIATATANAIREKGLKKVILLGTRFTMEYDFFRNKLLAMGIEPIVPDESERAFIQETIFGELSFGSVSAATKQRYLEIIQELVNNHQAEGVILGCTELPLVIHPEDVNIPTFDTIELHTKAAVDYALGE